MEKEYFEDCCIGDRVVTAGRTITETDIVIFSAFSADWNPVHTDAEYAQASVFGERVAQGMLTLVVGTGLAFRLIGRNFLPRSMIALTGIEKTRFIAPVRIGDTIYLEGEIADMTKTSGDQGMITFNFRIKNQQSKSVIMGRVKILARCSPPQGLSE